MLAHIPCRHLPDRFQNIAFDNLPPVSFRNQLTPMHITGTSLATSLAISPHATKRGVRFVQAGHPEISFAHPVLHHSRHTIHRIHTQQSQVPQRAHSRLITTCQLNTPTEPLSRISRPNLTTGSHNLTTEHHPRNNPRTCTLLYLLQAQRDCSIKHACHTEACAACAPRFVLFRHQYALSWSFMAFHGPSRSFVRCLRPQRRG